MADALDYDSAVIRSIHHIEDVCVKFALQNYASAGAVFVAYFTDKISLGITVLVVIGLAAVFTIAIWINVVRYSLFWKLHRIARNKCCKDRLSYAPHSSPMPRVKNTWKWKKFRLSPSCRWSSSTCCPQSRDWCSG